MLHSREKKRPLGQLKLDGNANNASNAVTVGNPLIDNCHDYASAPLMLLEDMNDFPPLPISPSQSPAPKKQMHSASAQENTDVVASLSKLINERADRLALQIEGLKKTINFACEEIKDVKGKVHTLETKVAKGEERLDTCMKKLNDLESHSRRMNLKLYGVKETEKEDVRKITITICQAVMPELKGRLLDTIDAVHRVGPKIPNSVRPRGIIMKFSLRTVREDLYKAGKTSKYLQDNGLRFALDLTKAEKDRRGELYPTIKKAREDGKTAYYIGARGFIEGVEIFPSPK